MNATISIRINPKTKTAAQKTLGDFGLDLSSGVKLFLEQVVETESIPFIIATKHGHALRNEKTFRKEVGWTLKHAKRYKNASAAFADIFKR